MKQISTEPKQTPQEHQVEKIFQTQPVNTNIKKVKGKTAQAMDTLSPRLTAVL